MPTSRIFLPDVNVWLALASRRHLHQAAAAAWMERVGAQQAAFCRITQMGLLRLLTNARAMGVDAIGQVAAWEVYRNMTADPRVRFLSEPAGLQESWRQLTRKPQPATNLWTDAYLQAFARLQDLQVVSFDQGFRRFADPAPLILGRTYH